ncbi:MAG: dienelactone hydrolase family protein [Nevskiales bacterium]
MSITPEVTTQRLHGRDVTVEIYRPQNKPVAAGVLYLHEIYGLIDAYREDAQDLASRGYLVYLPNLYTGGSRQYCVRAMVNAAGRLNASSSPLYMEIAQLLSNLRQDPGCSSHVGMIGMCLTGGFVIQAAMRAGVEAPVVYHHGLGLEGAGIPIEEESELVKVKRMQGHWSRVDPFCPAKRRARLKTLLGDRLEENVYNIPHGFRSLARNTKGSQLAWERTLAFFDQHLSAEKPPSAAMDE